jgi:predicted MFS family arabinose efflux permease
VSDRIGRVRTMRLTLLLTGVAGLVSALAWSPLALLVTRGLTGGVLGALYPASLVYVGDTVPAAGRQRVIATMMVGNAIGTAVASLAAGVIADLLSWRVAFALTAVAALVLAWRLGRLPEPARVRAPVSLAVSGAAVLRSRAALLVLGLAFVEGAVVLGGLTLLPPAVEQAGAGATLAGALTAVYGVAVLATAPVVGRLAGVWPPARLVALGATSALAAMALLALTRHPVAAPAAAALIALAWTAMHSSLQTWATEVLPEARATVISFFAMALFVGSALAAVAVAGLVDAGRYAVVFTIFAAVAVPLGLAASWGRARWRPAG